MEQVFYAPVGKPLNKSNSSPYFTENCVICLENQSTIELRPCGHAIICQACVSRLDETLCPLCRQTVQVIRVKGAKELYPFKPKVDETQTIEERKGHSRPISAEKQLVLPGEGRSQPVSFPMDKECQGHLELEVPFSNILEERRAFESFVRRRTYQVVVSGSVEVNTKALVNEVITRFESNLETIRVEDFESFDQQRSKNTAKIEFFSDDYYEGSAQSEPLTTMNQSIPLHTLFDTTSSAEAYLANACIENIPLHIRSFRIWELIRTLRQQKKRKQDLFILCCSAFSEISLNELIALDEVVSVRYVLSTPRIWVFLDVPLSESEKSLERKLTFEQVEEAFLKVPIHRRASKILHIQQLDEQNMELLGHDIVSLTKQGRRLERCNSVNNLCCFM
ncbi:metal ion binding protein [Galdieria sulphuraria]|uniref:Metal ion binding protein n=1 Tax=Galdieria sulphuraria TaxID=130081 RepID=M2Y4Y7_GALSU|nr:metal ion binding protein [Galdieria sulphuraria]EME30914.1 metal ion binding protein [Galdieria sulphuraria]|eukprot:XP_005707434.1 metal ion binding protein [Galdieria sulphuraria]